MPWLRYFFYILLIASSLSSVYLYSYATVKGCQFPAPRTGDLNIIDNQPPFRLLALGDPQLEGDTSIEHISRDSYSFSKLREDLRGPDNVISVISSASSDFFRHSILITLRALRKTIDLIGNDFYLAHVYKTLKWQTNPTHVAVLGDLLGSQWISDEEFDRRAWRYWKRVFKGGVRVEENITAEPTIEVLGEDKEWKRRVINIAGNHDVGYAGDLTKSRLIRFERSFGASNWEIVFQLPTTNEKSSYLRLVILNSMILDTPALDEELQKETYEFLNNVITRSEPVENRSVGTILLTHIPLYKKEGICVDSPYFSFGNGGRLREQNHLSEHVSRSLLEGLFGLSGNREAPFNGLGRNGIIINGHDHEGCDVWHYLPRTSSEQDPNTQEWNASPFEDSLLLRQKYTTQSESIPGIREVTLRSMMGEYGGWGYLISGWVDSETQEWTFEVNKCSAGVQHIWWAVHILILITAGTGGVLAVLSAFGSTPKVKVILLPPTTMHKMVPSVDLPPSENDGPKTPVPRSPNPFDAFDGKIQISGGRARRRRPG